MVSKIKTVGVCGTGVIGASWTGLFLAKGMRVLVSDPAPGAKEKLDAHLKDIWPVLERIGLGSGASLSNYEFVGASLDEHLGEVDFVQEVLHTPLPFCISAPVLSLYSQNAPEHLELKRDLFATLDAKTRSDVVIASSSSGLPSSEFVTDCKKNPARVLIGHPFNPPHLIPLVEIVPHAGTQGKYTDQAFRFYQAMGKKPIIVKKEIPGFVANRLQAAVCNEAYSLVQRGVVSAEELGS